MNNHKIIVLYRNFIDLLIRICYTKNSFSFNNINKVLEKIIERKFQ
jgi:hypothetical protein